MRKKCECQKVRLHVLEEITRASDTQKRIAEKIIGKLQKNEDDEELTMALRLIYWINKCEANIIKQLIKSIKLKSLRRFLIED